MKRMNMKVVLALSLVLLVASVAFAEKPKPIFTDDAPPPLAFYSQGVKLGNLVFVSGQLPYKLVENSNPPIWVLETASLAAATKQVMKNIETILAEAKLTLDDIVMATVYLNQGFNTPAFATEFNIAYAESFECICSDPTVCIEYECSNPKRRPPARASINAFAVPKGAMLEISVIAGK
jgi:2-iminobutanoate/2-iminopropanoate deaminase